MKSLKRGIFALAAGAGLIAGPVAMAQEPAPERFLYATYQYCDFSKQDRVDQIFEQVSKPVLDAAMKDGTINLYSYLAHVTGGQWRRVNVIGAGSVQAVLDAQSTIGDRIDANEKNRKLDAEAAAACSSHDDYIWRSVAGNVGSVNRGGASFSTYYVCDQSRESAVDAVVKGMIGPVLDKMVAEGKLATWGWLEHIVGGKYRRLATMSATDVKALMSARAAMVTALENNPGGDLLTDICPDHTDYIWENKFQAP